MHEYVDNILEKKIALVSLAIIMVLTGVTFGIGLAFQKRPQLLKGKCETMVSKSKMTVWPIMFFNLQLVWKMSFLNFLFKQTAGDFFSKQK